MTEWLNPTEDRLWRAFLEVSIRMMDRVDAGLREDADLSMDDYEVLVNLSEAPDGRLRMSELAEVMLHSRSRLTHRIDRMVEAGLVDRQTCPADKRGIEAVLTRRGERLLKAAAPGHVATVRHVLIDRFAEDEKAMMAAAFERLAEELRAEP